MVAPVAVAAPRAAASTGEVSGLGGGCCRGWAVRLPGGSGSDGAGGALAWAALGFVRRDGVRGGGLKAAVGDR